MVKVSKHYSLGRSQASLEFVDIDIRDDTPVFIDPGSLLYSGTTLARRCASLLQSFFGHIMHLIQTGQHGEAQALLATLNEPNETRFGFTEGRSSGHGMGEGLAANLWDALSQSRAAASGL
ncbi:MAG TPA: hypothetical protein VHO01_12520, partial [Jatrophihabitans sp.]|nr:hypothetical protein [Jatrophihabitans sp.]